MTSIEFVDEITAKLLLLEEKLTGLGFNASICDNGNCIEENTLPQGYDIFILNAEYLENKTAIICSKIRSILRYEFTPILIIKNEFKLNELEDFDKFAPIDYAQSSETVNLLIHRAKKMLPVKKTSGTSLTSSQDIELSHSELNSIFNAAPIPYFLVNTHGDILRSNTTAKKIYKLNNQNITNRIRLGNVFRCKNTAQKHNCGKTAKCAECVIRGTMNFSLDEKRTLSNAKGVITVIKDGKPENRNVLVSSVLISVSQEERILVSVEDITEKEQMLKKLQESEGRYRNLFDKSIDPIVVLKNDKIINCNLSTLHFFHIENKEDIVGKTFWELSVSQQPQDENTVKEVAHKMQEAEFIGNSCFEWQYIDSEDNITWFLISLSKIEHNDESFIYAVLHDISSRKKLEQTYLESERRLKQIFKVSKVGMIMTKKRNIKFANDHFCQMLGFQKNEVLTQNTEFLYTSKQDYIDTYERIFPKLVKHGASQTEAIFKRKNGAEINVLINSSFYNETDYEGGILSIITDITPLKKVEKSLAESHQSLLKENQEKDKFVSILAHDINSAIGGSLQLLSTIEAKGPKWDKRDHFIQQLSKNTNAAHELLTNLVKWGKASLGKEKFSPKTIRFTDSVLKNQNLYRSRFAHKQIKFNCNCDKSLQVFADSDMLNAILRNLIGNAIKFTNSGGNIDISVVKMGKKVKVTVSDNGVGMDANKVETLFMLDKLNSKNGTEGEPGTGLGLQIIKEYIHLHGGEIWAESTLGEGTRFHFTLPTHQNKAT